MGLESVWFLLFLLCRWIINILIQMDLWHKDKFYQYLVDNLLELMCLFFLSLNHIWLLLCKDDREFEPNLKYVLSFSPSTLWNLIIFVLFIQFLHSCQLSLLVLYPYISTESIDCILLSLVALNAIIASSVNTWCVSFLNPCCNFDISF